VNIDTSTARATRRVARTGIVKLREVAAVTHVTPARAVSAAPRPVVFGAVDGELAAIDRHGVIVAIDHAWARFAVEHPTDPLRRLSVGDSYLAACRRAAVAGDDGARRVLEAVSAVLTKGRAIARIECAGHSTSGERWLEIAVAPFRRPERGAVIAYLDVTRRRRAEEEAARLREQLAHAQRVTTLDEFGPFLAHEIAQPLAAISMNAEAAIRMLERKGTRLRDVSEALSDVAASATRAAAIVRSLRALCRKEHAQQERLDLRDLVTDVVALLRSDVTRKAIVIVCDLAPDLPPVTGDRVQLQQVIVNLLLNASEAIARAGDGPREIAIATARGAEGTVALTVRDSGIGACAEELGRMFQPFVTTKSSGLGLGLAISRSIVQAHGGRLWASPNPDRGLTLYLELPDS
jgi:C4-dicarboxylate-specific signal transduction histidine kinase